MGLLYVFDGYGVEIGDSRQIDDLEAHSSELPALGFLLLREMRWDDDQRSFDGERVFIKL